MKPRRVFVMIELHTDIPSTTLRESFKRAVMETRGSWIAKVLQVQVNVAKKAKRSGR
jgi:hypothetical protein